MKTSFHKIITFIIAGLIGISTLAYTIPTYAEDVCKNSNVPADVKKAAGCSNDSKDLATVIVNIINAIIIVSSIVAVIFVIIGGINYMTSTGEAGKLEKAKKTILYAVIGLVICALAFAIVNWAIGAIDDAT